MLILAFFIASCASHQYVPVPQAVKTPDKTRKTFTNVTAAALNQHRQAILLFNQGDYPGAARHWREALQAGARDADFQFEINYNLGATFLRMGKYILAEQHFRKAVALEPGEAKALAGLGSALSSQERYTEALIEYQKALAADPKSTEAYAGIAGISVHNGQFEQAIDSMRAATAATGPDESVRDTLAQAYVALAEQELGAKNYDRAEELFAQSAGIKPQNAAALFGLGRAMILRGYPGRAKPYYDKAKEIAPNYQIQPEDLLPPGLPKPDMSESVRAEGMAVYFAERGDFERAAEQYEMALTREPMKIETWLTLGDIYKDRLHKPERVAECIHALWMLGVRDDRVEVLAAGYGQEAPALQDKIPIELISSQAGLGFTPDARSLANAGSAFKAGSRVFRQAKIRVSPGIHKFQLRLFGPNGKVVREDNFEMDCVLAERNLTVFDTLPTAGTWKQEWTVDGKTLGVMNFQLE